MIALPVASADPSAIRPWVNSIDSYLQRHPDVHQQLQAKSQAEGGSANVIDYLNRHPDVRQHLIDLSQQCVPYSSEPASSVNAAATRGNVRH